jgi:hypothetical protein
MYRLIIIEYSFIFTNDSFNNQVRHEPNLIEPSPSEFTGSFVSFSSLDGIHVLFRKFYLRRNFNCCSWLGSAQ